MFPMILMDRELKMKVEVSLSNHDYAEADDGSLTRQDISPQVFEFIVNETPVSELPRLERAAGKYSW